jgi:hypothetical protein
MTAFDYVAGLVVRRCRRTPATPACWMLAEIHHSETIAAAKSFANPITPILGTNIAQRDRYPAPSGDADTMHMNPLSVT